jgi:hypothetical protein
VRYDLQLKYGPPLPLELTFEQAQQVNADELAPSRPGLLDPAIEVDVALAGPTTVTVDLSEVLGVVVGSVTLNGAPPVSPLALCVEATAHGAVGEQRTGADKDLELLWCPTLPADGNFRLLLPARRDVHAEVCAVEHVTVQGCRTFRYGLNDDSHVLGQFDFDVVGTEGRANRGTVSSP